MDAWVRALEGGGGVYSSSMSKGVILDALGRGLEGFGAGGRAGLAKVEVVGLGTRGGLDGAVGFAMGVVGFGMGAVGFDADAAAVGLALGKRRASRSSLSVSEGTLLNSRG